MCVPSPTTADRACIWAIQAPDSPADRRRGGRRFPGHRSRRRGQTATRCFRRRRDRTGSATPDRLISRARQIKADGKGLRSWALGRARTHLTPRPCLHVSRVKLCERRRLLALRNERQGAARRRRHPDSCRRPGPSASRLDGRALPKDLLDRVSRSPGRLTARFISTPSPPRLLLMGDSRILHATWAHLIGGDQPARRGAGTIGFSDPVSGKQTTERERPPCAGAAARLAPRRSICSDVVPCRARVRFGLYVFHNAQPGAKGSVPYFYCDIEGHLEARCGTTCSSIRSSASCRAHHQGEVLIETIWRPRDGRALLS